jgi:hypothetical protein
MPPSLHIHQLKPTDALFEDINVLLIAVASLATAATLRVDGKAVFGAGDYVTIEGRHLDIRVRLPLHGPVEAAIANRKPDLIELSELTGRDPERSYSTKTGGFANNVDALFLPFLVSYFQRHRAEVEAKHKPDRLAWPPSWQMGWALRNAASHGGVAFERRCQKPVAWRGLSFGPSDEPAKSLLKLLNAADTLLLLLEMDKDRV